MKHTRFLIPVFFFCLVHQAAPGLAIKLVETPLSQFIELYSKETGKNVFVDEGVQQQRRITAHLRELSLENAFELFKKTLGLESCLIGTSTVILYPLEKAGRYRAEMKPVIIPIPLGIDPKWILSLVSVVLPNAKATLSPGDERILILFGQDLQMEDARQITRTFPELITQRRIMGMSESEAKLALRELTALGVDLEAGSFGLAWRGCPKFVKAFERDLGEWRKAIGWKTEVFTPEHLDPARILKAAEAAKGRAIFSDLGGSGSFLVEGPLQDRKRLLEILIALDLQARRENREIALGELKPEAARDAVKASGLAVDTIGDRQMVLMGQKKAVNEAFHILETIGKKRKQVLITFRLAEVSKNRLKALGIELEKQAYTYGEIKEFHGKDTLPLLLKVINEGKDGRILAEPNLQVLEGEEAKVTIGDRIPLEVAATAQTESGSLIKLQSQLSWVDVGIKMEVKNVAVHQDGSIRMGLKGGVSSVIATTKQGYPQIRTREAESLLRVQDGGSVIMGGLLSREERENRNRIPWLSKLPLVGGFGKSRENQKTESEIVMIVTAKIAKE